MRTIKKIICFILGLLVYIALLEQIGIADDFVPHNKGHNHSFHENKKDNQNRSKPNTHDCRNYSKSLKNFKLTQLFNYIKKNTKKLGLSQDQVKEITEIEYDFKIENIKLNSDIDISKTQLDEAITLDDFNENEISSFIREISDLLSSRYRLKAFAVLDILRVLTPSQKKMIDSVYLKNFIP